MVHFCVGILAETGVNQIYHLSKLDLDYRKSYHTSPKWGQTTGKKLKHMVENRALKLPKIIRAAALRAVLLPWENHTSGCIVGVLEELSANGCKRPSGTAVPDIM